MSYNTALSGLSAAQGNLGVISHNIANASTVGFKGSRAEFGDIFANSALGASSAAIGSGVLMGNVSQQFAQGNMSFTENGLDLAVNGTGFFVMSQGLDSSEFIYTRAGQFGVDANGYVVNSSGQFLQVLPTNDDGTATSTSLSTTQPLQLPTSAGDPAATTEVEMGMNLPSGEGTLNPNGFDHNDASTYTRSTSLTVYDSLGNPHVATVYFVKNDGSNGIAEAEGVGVGAYEAGAAAIDPAISTIVSDLLDSTTGTVGSALTAHTPLDVTQEDAITTAITGANGTAEDAKNVIKAVNDALTGNNTWAAYYYVDDQPVDITGGAVPSGAAATLPPNYAILHFNSSGKLLDTGPASVTTESISFTTGADPLTLTFDYAHNSPTQYASAFNVTTLSQNGYTTGRLSGLEVTDTGVVRANYTNGQSLALGKVVLVDFPNAQGLKQLGNTSWAATTDAGDPLPGEAGSGKFGLIKSGALESSNVDLTKELVALITAQRNFQSNAKALETSNTLTQTIINLR